MHVVTKYLHIVQMGANFLEKIGDGGGKVSVPNNLNNSARPPPFFFFGGGGVGGDILSACECIRYRMRGIKTET